MRRAHQCRLNPVFPHLGSWDYCAYFQVLEEARKHHREMSKSMDSVHSELLKPICKDDLNKTQKAKEKKWWNNALLFLQGNSVKTNRRSRNVVAGAYRASVSGLLYIAYEGSWPNKTSTTRTASSRPLSGGITPAGNCELQIPYLNLNDFNAEEERLSFTSRLPIYFVT